MEEVTDALATNLPTFICHFSLDTVITDEVHGIGYVLLYKALTGCDNHYPPRTQSHTHTHNHRTIIILTFGESEVDYLPSKPPSNTEVSLIQMCLKFLFRFD